MAASPLLGTRFWSTEFQGKDPVPLRRSSPAPGGTRPGKSPPELNHPRRCLRLTRGTLPSHVSSKAPFPSTCRSHPQSQAGHPVRCSGPRRHVSACASVSPAALPPPSQAPAPPSRKLSDALWPGIGAFLTFCGLAALDHVFIAQRLSMSLASYGAVCSLLFALPKAPVSQPRRVLLSHVVCALIGVGAMRVLGSTWLARSVAVALSISFMILTDTLHPPAAGLPVIFIDGPKFHHLGWWYTIYPVLAGCLWIFLLQEMVLFLKERVQF